MTCVPMAMMASSGRPYITAKRGMRNQALKRLPNTVMTPVPSARDAMAPFLLSSFWYRIAAGSTNELPTRKFARSPTNAVDVPLSSRWMRTFRNSHVTPATGPSENAQIRTGSSLKSSL